MANRLKFGPHGPHRNEVRADDERNAKARLLHRNLLILAYIGSALNVEKAAHLSFGNARFHAGALAVSGDDAAGNRKVQLADFLFQGHFGHEFGNEPVNFVFCGFL